jgi:diguanylate cyclase (GGDEF)-like protein/PAS domain S-box-containing protein
MLKNLPLEAVFKNANDPQFILDIETLRFIMVNPAFARLTGSPAKRLVSELKFSDIVPEENLSRLAEIVKRRKAGVHSERYEFIIKNKDNKIIPVEISVRVVKVDSRLLSIGSMRDISNKIEWEKSLREKMTELAMATNRVWFLTEKIKAVPRLTSSLLKMPSEEHIIKDVCDTLVKRDQMNSEASAVYFLTGNNLELCYKQNTAAKITCDGKVLPRKIDIHKEHILCRALRYFISNPNISNPLFMDGETKECLILPLRGRDEIIGLLLLKINPKEKELMKDNPTAQKGYYDVLRTLVNAVGLAIENVRLTDTLKFQSIHDGLTGVYNRRYFEKVLSEEFARAKRYHRNLSLIFVDLDNFKTINDNYGHRQGDRILQEVGHLLSRNSRKVDSVCRYGGDEFAIIMPETNLKGAGQKADNITHNISNYLFTNLNSPQKPFRLKISAGISALSGNIRSAEEMILSADRMLFKRKNKRL